MNLAGATSPTRSMAQQLLAPAKPKTQSVGRLSADSPRLKAAETQKSWAREKIEQLGKLLKILKKLYANDPKHMARALAEVFKALRAAVKAYKAAVGDELGAGADVTTAIAQASAPAPQPTAEQSPADPEAKPATSSGDPEGASVYASTEAQFRKTIAEDGLSFLAGLRQFGREITDVLEAARAQAKARKKDKATDEAFEDADKAFKALSKDMTDMERDVRMAVPDAGMRLDVAA